MNSNPIFFMGIPLHADMKMPGMPGEDKPKPKRRAEDMPPETQYAGEAKIEEDLGVIKKKLDGITARLDQVFEQKFDPGFDPD